MAKTIHERFKKWDSSKNRITQQAEDFIWLNKEGIFDFEVFSFLDVLSAERERAFEAGYMSALKHAGGKKK